MQISSTGPALSALPQQPQHRPGFAGTKRKCTELPRHADRNPAAAPEASVLPRGPMAPHISPPSGPPNKPTPLL